MIRFTHLEKACDELGFELVNIMTHLYVLDGEGSKIMFFFPGKPWDLNFTNDFNFIRISERAKLIKAITRDYEATEKELEDAENNNM